MHKSDLIDPRQYPMLWRIMWDRRHLQTITLEDALILYEYRWDYVFQEEMPEHERMFLDSLIEHIGKGNPIWLSEGPVHVAHFVQSLDKHFFDIHDVFLYGGALLSLLYGGYRRTKDIDFVTSNHDTFLNIRGMIKRRGADCVFAQKYTISKVIFDIDRIHFNVHDSDNDFHTKLKISYDFHIKITGQKYNDIPLPALTPVELLASKLISNMNSFENSTRLYKDIIDIGMMLTDNTNNDIWYQALQLENISNSKDYINKSFLDMYKLLKNIDVYQDTKDILRINDSTFQDILLAISKKAEEIEAASYAH